MSFMVELRRRKVVHDCVDRSDVTRFSVCVDIGVGLSAEIGGCEARRGRQ